MVYDIGLQRNRDYKIRVFGKNSTPLTLFFCLFQFDRKQLHLFIIFYQEIYIRYPLNLHLSNTEKDIVKRVVIWNFPLSLYHESASNFIQWCAKDSVYCVCNKFRIWSLFYYPYSLSSLLSLLLCSLIYYLCSIWPWSTSPVNLYSPV